MKSTKRIDPAAEAKNGRATRSTIVKRFFDTNVLLYQYDASEGRKQTIADALIKRTLAQGEFLISTQVMMEFYHVATRKFAHTISLQRLQRLMLEFADSEPVLVSPALILEATSIHHDNSISWRDSTIVAAALHAEVDVLYSEDLQNHRHFGNLQIINPFLGGVHEPQTPYSVRRKK